jgi:hypothetical protein
MSGYVSKGYFDVVEKHSDASCLRRKVYGKVARHRVQPFDAAQGRELVERSARKSLDVKIDLEP